MKPFSEEQEIIVQEMLDDNFSRNGRLDVSEDCMRDITTSVLGIEGFKSKANFMFYDCRTPTIGLEFKKRLFDNPESQIGRYVEFTTSRTIDRVPMSDATESINYISGKYNAAIDEFENDCGGNVWFAGALYSKDTLVYYHEKIDRFDPSRFRGEWRDSIARAGSVPTHNLYVYDIETGEHLWTYLTKGEKLQVKFRVPERDNVHVFKAEKKYFYMKVSMEDNAKVINSFGSWTALFERLNG